MKLIIAVVRPFLIDRIVAALEDIPDFPGMTVTDSQGFGKIPFTTFEDSLNPLKTCKRIEIAAPDEMAEPIVSSIREHAHTGRNGDGIILVLPLEKSVLI